MKVRRNNRDWTASCADHNDTTWCSDWISAMEAAWGHIAMHHKRGCDHEWTYHPMGRPEERRCFDCGIDLPDGIEQAQHHANQRTTP